MDLSDTPSLHAVGLGNIAITLILLQTIHCCDNEIEVFGKKKNIVIFDIFLINQTNVEVTECTVMDPDDPTFLPIMSDINDSTTETFTLSSFTWIKAIDCFEKLSK